MDNTYPLFYIGFFTSIVLVAILIKHKLQGNVVTTFPAHIKDLRRTTIWTYVGVFVPIHSTTLIIEGDREVKVNEWEAKRLRVGDMIWVSQNSTGKYRFIKRLNTRASLTTSMKVT